METLQKIDKLPSIPKVKHPDTAKGEIQKWTYHLQSCQSKQMKVEISEQKNKKSVFTRKIEWTAKKNFSHSCML